MKLNISGANIRKYRLEKGITEEGLARGMCALGRMTTARQICEMEDGTRKVYDIDLVVIAQILDRTIGELLCCAPICDKLLNMGSLAAVCIIRNGKLYD